MCRPTSQRLPPPKFQPRCQVCRLLGSLPDSLHFRRRHRLPLSPRNSRVPCRRSSLPTLPSSPRHRRRASPRQGPLQSRLWSLLRAPHCLLRMSLLSTLPTCPLCIPPPRLLPRAPRPLTPRLCPPFPQPTPPSLPFRPLSYPRRLPPWCPLACRPICLRPAPPACPPCTLPARPP